MFEKQMKNFESHWENVYKTKNADQVSWFQPHLEKPLEEGQKVPREVLIVALSDLGAAGIAEKELFFKKVDRDIPPFLFIS